MGTTRQRPRRPRYAEHGTTLSKILIFPFAVSAISEAAESASIHLAFSALSSYIVKMGQNSSPLEPTEEELLTEVQALLGGAQIPEEAETALKNAVGEL